jgi:hypothetical protein
MIGKPKFHKKPRYRGVPLEVRESVFERCGGFCEGPVVREGNGYSIPYTVVKVGTCGEYATELSHVNPKKMGGSRLLDTDDNLVYLCKRHHDLLDGREHED